MHHLMGHLARGRAEEIGRKEAKEEGRKERKEKNKIKIPWKKNNENRRKKERKERKKRKEQKSKAKNRKKKRTWRELKPDINMLQARMSRRTTPPTGQQVIPAGEPTSSKPSMSWVVSSFLKSPVFLLADMPSLLVQCFQVGLSRVPKNHWSHDVPNEKITQAFSDMLLSKHCH